MSTPDYGYLQHGDGTTGPFRTECVHLMHVAPDRWFARYAGKWRAVVVQVNRLYIRYQGERITVQIEGV